MTSAQVILQSHALSAELAPLAEAEVNEVSRFIASQSARSEAEVETRLRWFLLQNPARTPERPIGFGLRAHGEIVGCILCSPQVFQCGDQNIVFMGSSSFYVDEHYRGHGGRIFLQYSRLANRGPVFGTSANPEAAALWKAAGARPIPASDGELLGVLNWAPLAQEFAHRRTSNRFAARLAGSSGAKLVTALLPLKIDRRNPDLLEPVTSALQASDLISGVRSEKLTALRDRPYIHWRYFSGHDPSISVFAFRSELSNADVLVTVNQRIRGYRGQIRTLNLLDVYPEVAPEGWIQLLGALIARYSGSVDALVLHDQSLEKRKRFCDAGFHWRPFDAPRGWLLNRTNHLSEPGTYFVPADGDVLI